MQLSSEIPSAEFLEGLARKLEHEGTLQSFVEGGGVQLVFGILTHINAMLCMKLKQAEKNNINS